MVLVFLFLFLQWQQYQSSLQYLYYHQNISTEKYFFIFKLIFLLWSYSRLGHITRKPKGMELSEK